MPLRRRLAIACASAVALAILLAAIVVYVVVRSELLGQVDDELHAQAALLSGSQLRCGSNQGPASPPGGAAPIWQIVTSDGGVACSEGNVPLPFDSVAQSYAAGNLGPPSLENVTVGGTPLRQLTLPITVMGAFGQAESAALQLARPLEPVRNVLAELRLVLFLLCAGGIALAACLGRLAAGRVLAPIAEVAETAQHITDTEDLTSRIHYHADDEVGQLATRFNAMIERLQSSREALDDSVRAQRQLVADASHELRTPITSLRTNIEVLLAGDALSEDDRHRLLADVLEQSEELSALIVDVIELARGDLPITSAEDVRLDRVVADCLTRARRDFPEIRFESSLEPAVVDGVPERLARAVNNLLDNAAHHSAAGGVVEVIVDERGLRVRDHGTGIDPADLPYVFDRFYRGANSRHRQGSGLGLAIVRQVAVQHGGSVEADNAPDGGAVFVLRLPTLAEDQLDQSEAPLGASGDPLSLR
ncbi:MAG TPA: HAMP domain-containing sensor histidine kinase [Solirubrobacteraceae bacterium]|nr:HAMP domain-containing sensor histidine kinase [Solirubrobacteraceae bacterium]